MGAADQEGGKSGGPRLELIGQRHLSGPETEVQKAKKTRGEGPPRFWIFKTFSLPQSLSPGLRTYVSVPQDAGGTGGRQTLSLAVRCPQKISAAPAGGAAGAPAMPDDLGPCQLLESGRRSYEIERQCSGGLSMGSPAAASIPAVRPLVPAQTPLDLASSFPFPKTKSITTNFKSHTEAGPTLAPQRGGQFQAPQERLLCIQGTDRASGQVSESCPSGRGVLEGLIQPKLGEAFIHLMDPSLLRGQGSR